MRTEVTSNGSSRSLNNTLLRSSVVVIGSLKVAEPIPFAFRITVAITPSNTATAGKPMILPARLPRVRSSRPAFNSITTNVNSTMMAPA